MFLAYSTYIGGSSVDRGMAMEVTPDLNAYLAGVTQSSNFPATGGFSGTLHGGSDGFVVRVGPPPAALITSDDGAMALDNVPASTGPSGARPVALHGSG